MAWLALRMECAVRLLRFWARRLKTERLRGPERLAPDGNDRDEANQYGMHNGIQL
jgi:hypothetical protein